MTMFGLEGMLRALAPDGSFKSDQVVEEVRLAYLDSLDAQGGGESKAKLRGTLGKSPALRVPRAPGNTCLSALRQGGQGTLVEPINNSKGCGAAMRVAPFAFLSDDYDTVFDLAARTGALTHGHVDGWSSGAVSRGSYTSCMGHTMYRASRLAIRDADLMAYRYHVRGNIDLYAHARELGVERGGLSPRRPFASWAKAGPATRPWRSHCMPLSAAGDFGRAPARRQSRRRRRLDRGDCRPTVRGLEGRASGAPSLRPTPGHPGSDPGAHPAGGSRRSQRRAHLPQCGGARRTGAVRRRAESPGGHSHASSVRLPAAPHPAPGRLPAGRHWRVTVVAVPEASTTEAADTEQALEHEASDGDASFGWRSAREISAHGLADLMLERAPVCALRHAGASGNMPVGTWRC